jgi:hypothetical protein
VIAASVVHAPVIHVLALSRERIDLLTAVTGIAAALVAIGLLTVIDLVRDRGGRPGRRLVGSAAVAAVTLLLVVGLRFAGLAAT